MAAADIRAGRAFVELMLKDAEFLKGLKNVGYRMRLLGTDLVKLGAQMAAAGAAITGPLLGAVRQFVDVGDSVADLATRTGVSVERLSELGYAAEQSGASLEQLGGALYRMRRRVANAASDTGPAVRALRELGLSAQALTQLDVDDIFLEIVDALQQVGDENRRAQLAFEIFGDAAKGLLPLINQGVDGIEQLADRARELGLVMSTEDARAAKEFSDLLSDLWKVVRFGVLNVGAALTPLLKEWVQWFLDLARVTRAWIDENRDTVASLFHFGAGLTIAGVGVAKLGVLLLGFNHLVTFTNNVVGAASTIYAGLGKAIGFLMAQFKALGVVMGFVAANPMMVMLAAITALVAAVPLLIQWLTTYEAQLKSTAQAALEAGDKQRQQDALAMKRLEQLAARESLSNREKREAQKLIDGLTQRYGDLGLAIDETTGKLTGLIEAQKKQRDMMRQAAESEIRSQIVEAQNNLAELRQRMEMEQGWWATSWWGAGGPAAVRKTGREMEAQQQKFLALQRRLHALRGGDPEAVLGGAAGEPEDLQSRVLREQLRSEEELARARQEAAAAAQRWDDIEEQLARQRRDRLENEIHDIRRLADERRALLDTQIAGTDDPVLRRALAGERGRIEAEASSQELMAVARHEEEQRRAREEEMRARLTEERHLQDEIARLQIRADDKLADREKRLRLIDVDEQRALDDALESGIDRDLVRRRFAAERALVEAEGDLPDRDGVRNEVFGTFSAAALAARGQGQQPLDRVARGIEKLVDQHAEDQDALRAIRQAIERGFIVA